MLTQILVSDLCGSAILSFLLKSDCRLTKTLDTSLNDGDRYADAASWCSVVTQILADILCSSLVASLTHPAAASIRPSRSRTPNNLSTLLYIPAAFAYLPCGSAKPTKQPRQKHVAS